MWKVTINKLHGTNCDFLEFFLGWQKKLAARGNWWENMRHEGHESSLKKWIYYWKSHMEMAQQQPKIEWSAVWASSSMLVMCARKCRKNLSYLTQSMEHYICFTHLQSPVNKLRNVEITFVACRRLGNLQKIILAFAGHRSHSPPLDLALPLHTALAIPYESMSLSLTLAC